MSTLVDPLLLAGDINFHMERSEDPDTIEFNEMIESYGLVQRVHGVTHDQGGLLDVVCTRGDLHAPIVDVLNVGFSDHRLLRWTSDLQRPVPVFSATTRRVWRSFSAEQFKADLLASALCDESYYAELDGDALASLYDSTICKLLVLQVPVRHITCRRRQSCVWFDEECRESKKKLRSSERTFRRLGPLSSAVPSVVASWRAERRLYHDLLHRKRSTFWTDRVNAEQSQPRRLWKSFNELLGRGNAPTCINIDATELHRHFDDKVAGVRAATADADVPAYSRAPEGCELRRFSPIALADVVTLVRALPDKQCSSDPSPTWLLKNNINILAPFLCRLLNWSIEHGVVPSVFKSAYITPLIKKADLDPADVKSYRPISNLSVLSKLLERVISKQLATYLKDNNLLPDLQSAYRANHSTETAVLKVVSDILMALDVGGLAVLVLLDLSAAFDSVDHTILLHRLRTSFGLGDAAISWFKSYLSDRIQHVRISGTSSSPSTIGCGLPQGSGLGPILFVMYSADLLKLIERQQLIPHAFADDSQIYGFCSPSDVESLSSRVSTCVDEVSKWMKTNRLQLK